MDTGIAREFVEGSRRQVDHARHVIDHCLDQLGDDDVWWTPREGCNSIGIIVQHLMGNLRQWAIAGVGGEPDVRDRPREFRVERRIPRAGLQRALGARLDHVRAVYAGVSEARLLEPRRIQGFDTTVLQAMYDTMCHLELHAGQIVYLTRLRLGERYEETWKPANREQGAAGESS